MRASFSFFFSFSLGGVNPCGLAHSPLREQQQERAHAVQAEIPCLRLNQTVEVSRLRRLEVSPFSAPIIPLAFPYVNMLAGECCTLGTSSPMTLLKEGQEPSADWADEADENQTESAQSDQSTDNLTSFQRSPPYVFNEPQA